MSALAYFLEDEGIATTGISLVREHTEKMRPPRFLWVPFPLGRPLGAPGNAEFQHDVIKRSLELLDAEHGPVLVDYNHDAPRSSVGEEDETSWVCPVNFAVRATESTDLSELVRQEVIDLAPWYAMSCEQRGRSTVGASGLNPEQALDLVLTALDDDDIDAEQFKYASEDLKAYYLEAGAVTPGANIEINRWLWRETSLAKLLYQLARKYEDAPNPAMRELIATGFIPREFPDEG